jgi:hypothetical protein
MKISISVFALVFLLINGFSQTPTIGLLHKTDSVYPGYTLFTPEGSNQAFLVDNCGEKVNVWTFSETPGATAYLLENGNLLRAGSDSLELRAWDNTLLWSYPTTDNGLKQHHDIEPLPNGNILLLLNDIRPGSELVAEGRDPSNVAVNFKMDRIVELEPIGTNQANIVWDWRFFDHLVQDFDISKPNYNDPALHPELLDLNYDNGQINDFTHVNGIDYHAGLDQIIMSARSLNEVYIIDHSTTTAEAAGHTGGNANRGGDFVWRWGNPAAYRQGTLADQKLFAQHDSKWVASGFLDDGKISVFNNWGDGGSIFSSIHLIEPDVSGFNYTMTGNRFNPVDFDWSWNGSILGSVVYQGKKSGCHALPNGNMIMCETSLGRVSEITKSGTNVWTYVNPAGSSIFLQFSDPAVILNAMFRGEKYEDTYPGLSGHSLTPLGIIENANSVSDACLLSTDIQDLFEETFSVVNPVNDHIIEYSFPKHMNRVTLMNMQGQRISSTLSQSRMHLPSQVGSGLYILLIESEGYFFSRKVVIR